jgi:DNA-binding NarL/FixJ family response regulator/anti-sigma regulatory factor (Ser/Thr protein kinase)
MKPARLLLGDAHVLMLTGIRTLLEPYYEVVGSAQDGRSLVMAALRLRPDLIILDVTMPILNGIDAARLIKKAWPEAKLLFLSMHSNPVYLREALEAGASGYLVKSAATEELRPAIERVLKGQLYVAPVFGDIVQDLVTSTGRSPRASAELTDRQREVLQLIVEGRSNKEIGEILAVSVKTVEFHRGRIMTKLGFHTAAELGEYHIAHKLHPSELEDLGLAAALRAYCEHFRRERIEHFRREGINVEFTERGVHQTVSREIASCLYKVTQEGLRNVVKHAKTKQASVTLEGAGDRIRLRIEDRGSGFPVESLAGTAGLGIPIMRGLVRLMKGNFKINSKPGQGTEISVDLPVVREGR